MHQVVVRALEQILHLEKTERNVALALLEQSWLFWYQVAWNLWKMSGLVVKALDCRHSRGSNAV